MYPSSQSAASLGLHAAAAAAAASLGGLPVSMAQQQQTSSIYSGATGGGILTTAADARVTPFNWQAAMGLAASGSGLFTDHQGGSGIGSKIPSNSSDKRSPSVQSASGGVHVSENSSANSANRFQPYRGSSTTANSGNDLLASGGSAAGMSGSQFAAFDSMYKAYQGAFAQGAGAAGLFTPQSMRFEDQLLTEQQLMLQASLLQYPHFGVFPGAAAAAASSGLYPGLAAASTAGIRFPPSDYYAAAAAAAAQSMPPGLLLPTMKFPNVSSSNWLGLDRLSGVSTSTSANDRDTKETRGDRLPPAGPVVTKDSEIIPRRSHDRNNSVRDKLSDHGHQTSGDRDDISRRDHGNRRPSDSELQRQERRQSGSHHHHHHSRPSPAKEDNSRHGRVSDNHQHHHNSQMLDGNTKQSSHHGGNSLKAERQHAGAILHGLPSEPLNLNKLMTSPDVGASSNHSRPVGRHENSWERQYIHQQFLQDRDQPAKEVRLPATSRPDSESANRIEKMTPLTLTIPPRPGIPVSSSSQLEQKFHRPFELPTRSDSNSGSNRVKTSKVALVATSVDSRPSFIAPERNGDSADVASRHATSMLSSAGPVGARVVTGEELPLNLVCRQSDSQQKHQQHRSSVVEKIDASAPVLHSRHSDVALRCNAPSGPTDGGRRHRAAVKSDCVPRPSPVVSKLDLKAAKRAERHKPSVTRNSLSSDEDNEDYDSDTDSYEKQNAKLLMIISGPPLKHDNSSTKRKFLEQFGLISSDACAEIEFEKRRKRRKLFRERSVSPIVVDDEVCDTSSSLQKLITNAARRTDLSTTAGHDTQFKAFFLFKHDLQPVDLHLKQKLSLMRCASDHEQKRAFEAVCYHIIKVQSDRSQHAHNSTETLVSNHRPSRLIAQTVDTQSLSNRRSDPESSSKLHSNAIDVMYSNVIHDGDGRSSTNRQHRKHGSATDNCEQIQDGRSFGVSMRYDGGQTGLSSSALDLSSDSGSDQRAGATIAFADFPSPQSSSICMTGVESSTPACLSGKSARLPDGLHFDATSARSSRSFQWPGIDAIMESYQLHMEEQVMERQLLTEQCQRLKHRHIELTRNADRLANLMSDLLHGRQQLNDERSRLQATLDGLKKVIGFQR